jgi:hypothetical protein
MPRLYNVHSVQLMSYTFEVANSIRLLFAEHRVRLAVRPISQVIQ